MKQIFGILIIGILLVGCKGIKPNQKKVEFNQELADELSKMAEIDQLAAGNISIYH